MAQATVAASIEKVLQEYMRILRENNIPVLGLYLFGSHAKGAAHGQSDMDLAVFWDKDEIDGYDEDVRYQLQILNYGVTSNQAFG